ncbi:conserved hypothetical protein [Ricinus communis]|uniref:Reverse transcriptase zinc-binding domain-containing protein n=1 Tax=Ricinus communis TaxID=3988 RepID=B9S3S2_RICCO|nr:conserved hypothetical protein [Ricinus communis]
MVHGQLRWNRDLIENIFNQHDASLILHIPLSNRQVVDRLFWVVNPKGDFTVKSCYRLLCGDFHRHAHPLWNRLWKLPIPYRVCNLILLFANYGLASSETARALSTVIATFFGSYIARNNLETSCILVMVCWWVWRKRNDVVWRNKWNCARFLSCPPVDKVKANVDAAVFPFKESNWSWVCSSRLPWQNDWWLFYCALGSISVKEAEALGVREALS